MPGPLMKPEVGEAVDDLEQNVAVGVDEAGEDSDGRVEIHAAGTLPCGAAAAAAVAAGVFVGEAEGRGALDAEGAM